MTNLRRLITALLASLMLVSVVSMAACGGSDKGGPADTQNGNAAADTTAVDNTESLSDIEKRALIPDDLPDKRSGGRDYRSWCTESQGI